MNEFAREITIAIVSSLFGALLGSLGTIAAFRVTLVRLETRFDSWQREMGRIDEKAEKASTDANRAWAAVRGLDGFVKGQTGEVPRYEPRDSGEQEASR